MAAITTGAPPQVMLGGEYSQGPALGVYHTTVTDAALASAKSGRPQLILELTVTNDPDHAAKNGKKLTRVYQSLPYEGDDADKAKTMKGMVKRMVYDGLGVEWPKKDAKVDPRIFVGKECWVKMDNKKDQQGNDRAQVVAIATSKDKLPGGGGLKTEATPAGGRRR